MKTKNTHSCNSLRVFSASVQVGRIQFAKSINPRHFSLILNLVLGSSVPLSFSERGHYFGDLGWWHICIAQNVDQLFVFGSQIFLRKQCSLFFKGRMIEMFQGAATEKEPLFVRTQKQQNSHQALFIKRFCTMSHTPSCISSWIYWLLGFLFSNNFSFFL